MAQRLVLKTEKTIALGELGRFYKSATAYGMASDTEVDVHITLEGEAIVGVSLLLDLPTKVRVADGKRVVVRPKTAKQKAVETQIKEHKNKKAKGEQEAYVPPVGRKTAPKQEKAKCPVCNVRKPVVRLNRMKTIKPHVSQGEPCPGSGEQVAAKATKK
jgi:hypothetical protein